MPSGVPLDGPEPRRFVVCGDDTLAYRLADELANRHGGAVTVILRSTDSGYGRRIAKLPGVRVIEADRPDADAYHAAGLTTADGLALVDRDDMANIEAALVAHEHCPELRMVVRMFNTSLSEGIAGLPYCTVLSDGELTAPAFVAAALGDTTPRAGLRDDTMFVAHRDEVPSARHLLCGLAVTDGRGEIAVLPANQDMADLVLARVTSTEPTEGRRRHRLTQRYSVRTLLVRIWLRVRLVLGVFAGLLLASAVVLGLVRPDTSWWDAFYLATSTALAGADADLAAGTVEQVTRAILTALSIALIPLLTGAVVDAVIRVRQDLAGGVLLRGATGHVVVVGLGGVGSHVITLLHEQGVDVVGIDRSAEARGAQIARDKRIPLIIGDASRRETLAAAAVPDCRCLVVVTSDNTTNLETALVARALRRDLRVVLRLFDGDFADRIQRTFDLTISRSVSYLAAPSFTAHLLGQKVEAIPVGRRVLLVAELTVEPYARLENETVAALRRPGEAWLVELITGGGARLPQSVPAGRRLRRGDQLVVVGTRAGLARLMAEAAAPPESDPRPPILLFDTPPPRPRDDERPDDAPALDRR